MIAAWATNLLGADAAGVMAKGSIPIMSLLLGLGLTGLGMWGRKKVCRGTRIDGR